MKWAMPVYERLHPWSVCWSTPNLSIGKTKNFFYASSFAEKQH